MRQLTRLARYVLPYSLQLIASVTLMAGVGFLEAFRWMLLRPILYRVLKPDSGSVNSTLYRSRD